MSKTFLAETASTVIYILDDPDPNAGGACHEYLVEDGSGNELCRINFQHGPIGEAGVNGIQHADLLLIIQHRLDCFQRGAFASAVNEVTAGAVGAALASEGTRTRRRSLAGVEGRNLKAPGVEG
jgi:hypothetical protein